MFETFPSFKELILGCTPLRSIGFKFEYLSKFKVKILTDLECDGKVQIGSSVEKRNRN
jgi:hypothetical protein